MVCAFTHDKNTVLEFYAELDAATNSTVLEVLKKYTDEPYLWVGFHPFNKQNSAEALGAVFWCPLKNAFSNMQRRMDIFMAGHNSLEECQDVWVVSMGHLVGLFDQEWLGIPPTGKMTFLPYCEFNRVRKDKISETAMYFDIPHVMMQAGLNPFPPQTAAHLIRPGPILHDGLLFEEQPPDEGTKTLSLINTMISDLGDWNSGLSLEGELRRTWAEDMVWWGPAGIGSTYTIPRYAAQHSGPFRTTLTERSKTKHVCRMAEGYFGGFFGWPNFTARPTGGFMGMPGTEKSAEFRVIDIYRRAGEKLAENWVFIDLLHFWNQQGLDILKRMCGQKSY